jgi:hypothetical protein
MIYPREPWQEHLANLKWEQGEHMLIAAPTGSGKTDLASKLIERRGYVVDFITKIKDPIFTSAAYKEWDRVTEWRPGKTPSPWQNRVLLWPRQGRDMIETRAIQKDVFKTALEDIFKSGGWCAVFDELHYMTDNGFLNLYDEVAILHHMGRSNNVTLVNLTQRPAWIPKIIYSSVSHAYIARTKDSGDLKRLADLGGVDGKLIAVSELPTKHDFLYVNPMGDKSPVVVNIRH